MIPSIFPPDSSPCAQPSVLTEKNLQTIEKPKAVFPRRRMAQSNSFLSGSSRLLTLIYLPQFGGFIAYLSFFSLLFVLFGNVKTMSMLLSADSWSLHGTGGRTPACSSCTWPSVLELWLCPLPPWGRRHHPQQARRVPHHGPACTTGTWVQQIFHFVTACCCLGRWVLGETAQFPVNYLVQVVSAIYHQFCPTVFLRKESKFESTKWGPVSAHPTWNNLKQILWEWGAEKYEWSGLSWGHLRGESCCGAGASPVLIA